MITPDQRTASVDEVRTALADVGVADTGLTPDDSLIRSGLLDSVALFNLSLWIEERTGAPIDPTSFNVASDWDTMQSIAAFIEGHRGTAMTTSPPAAAESPPTPPPTPPPPQRSTLASDRHAGLRVITATPAHDEAIARLMTRLWTPSVEVNLAYYRWKYRQHPFTETPFVHLVVDAADKPVAMRGYGPSEWEAAPDGQTLPTQFCWYCVDDLIIMPEYESRGLYALLVHAGNEAIAQRRQSHYLSLSAVRVTWLQSVAYGSHSLGTLAPFGRRAPMATIVDRFNRLIWRLPLLWRRIPAMRRAAAARAFSRLDRALPAHTGADTTLTVSTSPASEQLAQFVASLPYDGRIRHVRNAAYFDWRYRNPLHEHRFVYLSSGAALRGYLVLERALSDFANGLRINIVDWEARSPEDLRVLLEATLRIAAAPELATWTATCDPDRVSALRACGLAPIDVDATRRGLPSILVSQIGDQAPTVPGRNPLTLADWDIRMIYTSAV